MGSQVILLMNGRETSEIHQQIEQAQDLSRLWEIRLGIVKSADFLLAEFEEKILNKMLDLLREGKEPHWCSKEEFAFLIEGLNSKQKDKYNEALALAMNSGVSRFQVFDPIWEKFLQENGTELRSFKQSVNVLPLLNNPAVKSRINGVRGAINRGEFEKKDNDANKRRRNKTPEQQPVPDINSLPFGEIVENLYQLSMATLSCSDRQKQLIILDTFEDFSLDKKSEGCDLFDILKFSHQYYPDHKVRCKAQYVLETFTALGAYIAQDIRGRYKENGEVEIISLNPRKGIDQSKLKDNVAKSVAKGAILETIFDQRHILADDRLFGRDIDSVGFSSLSVMTQPGLNFPAFYEKPNSFVYDQLADQIVKFVMEQEFLLLKKEGYFGGFIIPSELNENKENILITWRGQVTHDNFDLFDKSMLEKLRADFPKILDVSNKPLEIADLAAILAITRPELELDESTPLEELKDRARGGMFPISKRGIGINLDENQIMDKYLTQIGLKKITFRRVGGIHDLEVTLQLGKRAISFSINEQMEIPALASIASAEKNWIERVIFSYLIAVKNRDLYQSSAAATRYDRHQSNANATNQTKENQDEMDKRPEVTNSSHLYVLPFSYQPEGWDDPYSAVNLDVKEEFGYSLLELNLHFSMAQQDLKYLEKLEDKTLRRIILSSLKRLENKSNPENWMPSKVAAIKEKIREAMIGTETEEQKTQQNSDDEENIALIGFKHEPLDPIGPPIQIKLNGVTNQIFTKQ